MRSFETRTIIAAVAVSTCLTGFLTPIASAATDLPDASNPSQSTLALPDEDKVASELQLIVEEKLEIDAEGRWRVKEGVEAPDGLSLYQLDQFAAALNAMSGITLTDEEAALFRLQ